MMEESSTLKYYKNWVESIFHGAWYHRRVNSLIKEMRDGSLLIDLINALNWCDNNVVYSSKKLMVNQHYDLIQYCLNVLRIEGVPLYGIKAKDIVDGDIDAVIALLLYLKRFLSWSTAMREKSFPPSTNQQYQKEENLQFDNQLFEWVSDITKLTVIDIDSFNDGLLFFKIMERLKDVCISFSFFNRMNLEDRFSFLLDTIYYQFRVHSSLTICEFRTSNGMRRALKILKKYDDKYQRYMGVSTSHQNNHPQIQISNSSDSLNENDSGFHQPLTHTGVIMRNDNEPDSNNYSQPSHLHHENGRASKLGDFQASVDTILEQVRSLSSRASRSSNHSCNDGYVDNLNKSLDGYNETINGTSEQGFQSKLKVPPPTLPKPKKQENTYKRNHSLSPNKISSENGNIFHKQEKMNLHPSNYKPPTWNQILREELQHRNKSFSNNKNQYDKNLSDNLLSHQINDAYQTKSFEDFNLTKYDLEVAAVFENDEDINDSSKSQLINLPSHKQNEHRSQIITDAIKAQSRNPSGMGYFI